MKKWDKEYSTQYTPENLYLEKHDIFPVYTKIINEVSTYKYMKSRELFLLLSYFYV